MNIIQALEQEQLRKDIPDFAPGDTLKVHVKVVEGSRERIQVFEGVVIRTDRKDSHTARITVRKIAAGVGVEKSFLIHSPLVEKIEVTKRAKVRRKNLTYLRERSGKSARLTGKDFDRAAVNELPAEEAPVEEAPKAEEAAEEKAEA